MPVAKYRDVSGGMAPDVFVHKQAENQYQYLKNYRIYKNAISKIGGQQVELLNMPLNSPTLLDFWRLQTSTDVGYFVSALAGQVWKTAPDGTDAQITRSGGDYVDVFTGGALSATSVWTSTQMFGGLTFILSNEQVTPQYVTSNALISPAGLLQDLPGWIWNVPGDPNPYVAQTAKVVRAFDNQLWAGNITKKRQDGTLEYYPNLILYSDKATNPANTKQNYIPDTWQPSSGTAGVAANWAGYSSLNTSDPIIDMLPLRDTLLVFTTNRTYVVPKLQTTQQPLSPQILSTTRGLLSNDCAVAVDGYVFMVTTDDIVLTTGASIDFRSIANNLVKDTFFNEYLTRDPSNQNNVFVRYNRFYNEVWVFFPSVGGQGACNRALIWDVESRAWTLVDTPAIYSAVYSGVIGENTGIRNWTGINYAFQRLHFQSETTLVAQDVGYQRNWGPGFVGTIGTELVKVFDLEERGTDSSIVKTLRAFYPYIQGDTNATVSLKFSNIPFSTGIDWSSPDYSGVFTTTEDYKIDPLMTGRYMAVRIMTADNNEHNITSFNLDIDTGGRRG